MNLNASIDRVIIETLVTAVRQNSSGNIELSFENNDKLTLWRDTYIALGMPTVWDKVEIVMKPQSSRQSTMGEVE